MAKGCIEWENNEEDGLVLRFKPGLGSVASGEILQHALTAKKEMLLTLRSLIDIAITRMDKKETQTKKRGTKIKVE